ncbi:EAL domain-containing protein [Pseudorhodoferax sp.]|uniref:EAL domain-containing protein n=1 Tax=Pseudorhodoferax sp. TaxID=1993553 RepID=UPI0039E6FF51
MSTDALFPPREPAPSTLGARLRQALERAGWWCVGVGTALLLAWMQPQWLQRLDLLAYDLMLPQRSADTQAPVVVAVDDDSLERLGAWPWPRTLHARMVDALRDAGAGAVGIAVLFAEPDQRDPAGDAALAAALARHGRVALAVAPARRADGRIGAELLGPRLAGPAPQAWLGHVDVETDLDGQSRSQYLYAGPGRADVPALALAVHELAGTGRSQLEVAAGMAPRAGGDDAWIRQGEAFVPRTAGVPVVSFAAALADPALLAQARGRAVFIGATAGGLGAMLATPLAQAPHAPMPAVLFHAQVLDALQHGSLITRLAPPWSLATALLLTSLVCAACLATARHSHALPLPGRALAGLAVLAAPLLLSAALLQYQRWLPPGLAVATLAVALTVREAAKLRAVQRQLQRSRQHAQAALRAIDDAVITIDAQHRTVRFANPTAQLQAAPQLLQGRPLQAYPLQSDSHEALRTAVDACLGRGVSVHLRELLYLRAPGGLRSLRATANPLRGPSGGIEGAVLVFNDMTAALAATREREHAATHDALTGLPNRVLLQERLQLALSRVQRQRSMAAILFVDLDRFKHINDTLGHRAGDEVLRVMGQRLRDLCRDTDTVARWGGDEFVLILEDIGGPEGAAMAAAKIVDALSWDIALGAEFNHRRLPSSGSVGVVLVPRDGTEAEDLLSKADMAMYRAKSQPKASFHIWADDINARMHDRLALEVDLRQALQNAQLVLHYQPQVALGSGRLVGMEALMRWQRTPAALLPPAEFLPVAEESGLIIDMGAWAVREAARQVAAWQAAGLQPVPVAVNVSARQCMTTDLAQVVRQALRETGIAPRLLRLEITETTAMAQGEHVIALLQELQALGIALSLDDFGTGCSSLAHLKHFPLSELKIDRSFVAALPEARHDAAIVHATVALARGLDLRVVAEGVENEAQARFLAGCGCDCAQGYLYGRPQPAAQLAPLLSAR